MPKSQGGPMDGCEDDKLRDELQKAVKKVEPKSDGLKKIIDKTGQTDRDN